MSFTVDYALPALKILLEEFNSENKLNLTLDEVEFSNFVAVSSRTDRSSIKMTCKDPTHGIGSVVLYYIRMDLAHVFSLTGLVAKDFDWDIPYDFPLGNERLIANLFHRYKVPFNATGYDFVKKGGGLYIVANDTNMVFQGEVRVDTLISQKLSASVKIPEPGPLLNIVEVIRVNPKV